MSRYPDTPEYSQAREKMETMIDNYAKSFSKYLFL